VKVEARVLGLLGQRKVAQGKTSWMTEKTTTTTSKMARIGCSQKKKKPIAQTQRNKKFYVSVILEALTEALTDLGACRPWVRNKGDQPLSLVFAPFPLQAHFA